MSVEAARLVTALINALLYGVSDVVGTIETSMRGPRDRDRDDDGRGPRGHTERRPGDTNHPTGADQRKRREDRRNDGSRQRKSENKGRHRTEGTNKQAVDGSAGLTLNTTPTTSTWPRLRLFL
jgi:hypothetical protein